MCLNRARIVADQQIVDCHRPFNSGVEGERLRRHQHGVTVVGNVHPADLGAGRNIRRSGRERDLLHGVRPQIHAPNQFGVSGIEGREHHEVLARHAKHTFRRRPSVGDKGRRRCGLRFRQTGKREEKCIGLRAGIDGLERIPHLGIRPAHDSTGCRTGELTRAEHLEATDFPARQQNLGAGEEVRPLHRHCGAAAERPRRATSLGRIDRIDCWNPQIGKAEQRGIPQPAGIHHTDGGDVGAYRYGHRQLGAVVGHHHISRLRLAEIDDAVRAEVPPEQGDNVAAANRAITRVHAGDFGPCRPQRLHRPERAAEVGAKRVSGQIAQRAVHPEGVLGIRGQRGRGSEGQFRPVSIE